MLEQIVAFCDDVCDEGELNSEDESEDNGSSEGVTTDGEVYSEEDDASDKVRSSIEETPWERGLRLAKERAKKAKLLRQTDVNLEEKKLKLAVIAPDTNEENLFSVTSELSRSNLTDVFWLNYYKPAIVGCTQLTCKRSLPSDLLPPSPNTMSRWRRHLHNNRARSADASSKSSVSTAYRSRASSLSSMAGSILLAVPDLIVVDDSDREQQRRHWRVGGRRGSSSSAAASRRIRGSTSSHDGSHSRRSSIKAHKTKRREASSVSSSSSSSSRSVAACARNRSGEVSGVRENSLRRPTVEEHTLRSNWRGRRAPLTSYENHRQPLHSGMTQISGYHHQQRGFCDRMRDDFIGMDNVPSYAGRHNVGDSSRWQGASHRSPDLPPPMPSEKPIKRPWVADPSLKSKVHQRSQSPTQRVRRSSSERSRSRNSSPNGGGGNIIAAQSNTTYITSWSQPRDREASTSPHQLHHRGSLRRHTPPPINSTTLPEVVPPHTTATPPLTRKRPASSRRKSRSPFANIDFAKPPEPMRCPSLLESHGLPSEDVPFEHTVPLLAGAINPVAPPGAAKALPSASSRPGVKLKIAPRVRSGPVLPESALNKAHQKAAVGRFEGSPISSASSIHSVSVSPTRPNARRARPSSPPAGHTDAKRLRHLGYTAVSPGDFDSPPLQTTRSYGRNERSDKGRRVVDQGREDYRVRGSGENHESGDRFRRGGFPHQLPERYRERRQPMDYNRRGLYDRNQQLFDRRRSGRDFNPESHYGRPRAQQRDNGRSYAVSRHDNRRQGNAARSRSPFEGRGGGGSGDIHTDFATEQRLHELRQRLTMVDDKIAELGGASTVSHR